ncbi:MAG: FtsW/RodA/SpoVE family cell cycle protein [Candidatus Babeliales bacterium]
MLHQKNRYFFLDWVSFALTLVLTLIGLLFVYSSTTTVGVPYSIYFKKQVLGIATGLAIYLFFCFKDYRALCRFGYFAFFTVMLLLVYTLIKGKIGMGAQRWIDIKILDSNLLKLPNFFSLHFLPIFYTQKTMSLFINFQILFLYWAHFF